MVVYAYSAFTILWLLVWQFIASRLIGVRIIDSLKDIVPFMVRALTVMVATYYMTYRISNNLFLLLSRILIAAALYCLIMRLTGAKVMDECIRFVLRKS